MRVLVIGDLHEPCTHPGYLHFCRNLRDRHRCNRILFIGDIADWHAVSFHAHHPEMPGPKDEYRLAKKKIAKWANAFPDAEVCIGNHDERLVNLAQSVNIPSDFLRNYAELWSTPGWTWATSFTHDDVYYTHGTGTSGDHPAYTALGKYLMSVVLGHTHHAAGLSWKANPTRRIFGMDTGCGISDGSFAFAYGRHFRRPILSAGVVLDGIPHHEICPIGPGERYHKSRYKSRQQR